MVPTLGIVVPAYRPDVERLLRYLDALNEEFDSVTLLVELDAADTETACRLADGPATIHTSPRRRGKGAAITAGFERLDTDVLAFTDADGSTSPTALRAVIDPVMERSAGMAVGSRRHPASNVLIHQSHIRRRLGDLFVRVARRMLPVQLYDYQCGAKAIDRRVWNSIKYEVSRPGFAWDIEVLTLVALTNVDVQEIPIVWEDHPGSTVSTVHTSFDFGQALFRGWHRTNLQRGHPMHRFLDRFIDRPHPLIPTEDGERITHQ